jgi:MYXO-CTERM domain-containing protein
MTILRFACPATVATTLFARAASAQPAFPGAEGFGAGATGGRGGQVIRVTTLAANGPGSLQAALDTPGPRIVVFTVSGVIDGDIAIPHGDVTIAGQTAPGAGITIAGRIIADYDAPPSNIVIRHLRIRPAYDGSPGDQFDGSQFARASNLMLDHVSVSWGVDETLDLYEADDVTLQWSTVEESATMGHPEGEHNYGMIQGPDGFRISVHHNVFVHHKNRNPAIANGPAEVVNNVAYNIRHGFVHHNPASGPFNIVGNAYIDGANDDLIPFFFDDENGFTAPDLAYYLADNYIEDPGVFTGTVDNPWMTPFVHPSFEYLGPDESFRAAALHDFTGLTAGWVAVTTQPSGEAMPLVLTCAGGFPRDTVTTRVLSELEQRTGGWGVDAPADLLEGLSPGTYPADTDGDAMPDAWETDHGLDPNDGADHTTVMPSGYTAIEDYLNELSDQISCAPPGPGPTTSSAGAGGASGSTGAESGSGNGSGAGSGSGGAGAADGDGGGCDCRVEPSTAPHMGALFAALAAAALAARRRRA